MWEQAPKEDSVALRIGMELVGHDRPVHHSLTPLEKGGPAIHKAQATPMDLRQIGHAPLHEGVGFWEDCECVSQLPATQMAIPRVGRGQGGERIARRGAVARDHALGDPAAWQERVHEDGTRRVGEQPLQHRAHTLSGLCGRVALAQVVSADVEIDGRA
eukprot:CAMPEP_0185189036 /NCGR_PEP_ID=MMETSP1140-20130426/5783_1 /TAXON_ID=298111 /ORGANISM="Pavlova sp., Strain CCMP459" /LENGTH=158 /DNA_ID=CAMNT_0027755565 /DNA_START=128 /DNA_END=604 /DNA_ORIENTATION=-